MSDSTIDLTFRPMFAADFPMMTAWLAQPHVKAFYGQNPTFAEVCERYGPRLADTWPTRCHIAESRGRPFGYLQSYRNADWPEWGAQIGDQTGLSIDLYIGEPAFVGRGFGRAMLAAYVHDIAFPRWPQEQRCYIAHAITNVRALACSKAVGFRELREFDEDGARMRLLVIERSH